MPHRKDPSSLHFQRAEGAHPTARACCIADAASATSPHPSSLTNPTHTTAQPHHAPMCPPNPSSPTNPARTSLCRIPSPPWAPTYHLSQTPPAWRWHPRQWPPSAAPHSPPPAGTARLGGSTGSAQAVVRHGLGGGAGTQAKQALSRPRGINEGAEQAVLRQWPGTPACGAEQARSCGDCHQLAQLGGHSQHGPVLQRTGLPSATSARQSTPMEPAGSGVAGQPCQLSSAHLARPHAPLPPPAAGPAPAAQLAAAPALGSHGQSH